MEPHPHSLRGVKKNTKHTVDGRNLATVDRWCIPLFRVSIIQGGAGFFYQWDKLDVSSNKWVSSFGQQKSSRHLPISPRFAALQTGAQFDFHRWKKIPV
jgi:hypothetical protein